MKNKQDISQEQFCQICKEFGFNINELNEPWNPGGKWYTASIPDTSVHIAGYIPEANETNVCDNLIRTDANLFNMPYKVNHTVQPTDIQSFKDLLSDVLTALKEFRLQKKLEKMAGDFIE